MPYPILSQFPLHPIFPHTGKVYILSWSAGYTPTGVVIARSPKAIERAFYRITESRRFVQVDAYVIAEIVSPPIEFQVAFAKLWHSIHLDEFTGWASYCFRNWDPLPEGLEPCETCKNITSPFAPWCRNCNGGVVVQGESWDDFYQRNRETFHRFRPSQNTPFVGRASEARELQDGEDLYGIWTDPGYFEAKVQKIDLEENAHYLTWGLFYTNPQDVDPTIVLQIAEDAEKEWKRQRQEIEEESEAQQNQILGENREVLRSMLSGKVRL